MPKAKRLPSGNWRARGYNKTTKTYKSFTDPKKSVAERLAAEYAESASVVYENLTLGQAYDRYIDSKSKILSPSTLREYRKQKNRDFPDLLPIQLKRITPELIQTAVNELQNSPKTVRNKFMLLKSVLNAYRPDLKIDKLNLPQKKKQTVIIPPLDDILLLLDNADDIIRVPILLGYQAGLRRSEICALTQDDFTDIGVNITKAMVKGEDGYEIKPPKTTAGERFVPLSRELLKECKAYDFSKLTPVSLQRRFERLAKKCGVDIHFHLLRHYFCSKLISNRDISLTYLCSVGGWSDPSTPLKVYAHVLEEEREKMSEKAVSLFENMPRNMPRTPANPHKIYS